MLQSEHINFIWFPYIVPSPILKLLFWPLLPTQFHTHSLADQLIHLLLGNNFKLKLWVWPSAYKWHQTQDPSDSIELTAEGNKTNIFFHATSENNPNIKTHKTNKVTKEGISFWGSVFQICTFARLVIIKVNWCDQLTTCNAKLRV